jgi:hypothetical protein
MSAVELQPCPEVKSSIDGLRGSSGMSKRLALLLRTELQHGNTALEMLPLEALPAALAHHFGQQHQHRQQQEQRELEQHGERHWQAVNGAASASRSGARRSNGSGVDDWHATLPAVAAEVSPRQRGAHSSECLPLLARDSPATQPGIGNVPSSGRWQLATHSLRLSPGNLEVRLQVADHTSTSGLA